MSLHGTKFDCHQGTSFSPEKRAEQEKKWYDQTMEEFKDAPPAMLERLKVKYDAYLSAKSRVLSPMITGPARFPTQRNQKRIDAERKAWSELDSYMDKIRKTKEKEKRKAYVEACGGELAMAKRKLAGEKAAVEFYKDANKVIRSKPKNEPTETKLAQLRELGCTEEEAKELFKPDFMGRYGFASYHITNARNRVKNTEKRLAELERREVAKGKESEEYEFQDGWGKVVLNHAENRIEIYNEEKPERSKIQQYKDSGFKWSRFKGCWQRQITIGAKLKAEDLTGVDLKL